MLLGRLVEASGRVAATRSRLRKRGLLSDCLREAGPGCVGMAVAYLTGHLPQGRIGLGPAIVSKIRDAGHAGNSRLTLGEVDTAFEEISKMIGEGSQQRRRDRLGKLFAAGTPDEQDFLARLIVGDLRQGALEGVLADAIAEAADLEPALVRRAAMLAGSLPEVAEAALTEGRGGLERFRLRAFSPVQPMLAAPAEDIDDAMASFDEAVLDYKLDGARVQIHKDGDVVRVFSRGLNDVTDSVPELVETTLALPVTTTILDGEVIALRPDGRPHPFQVTMRRFGRKSDVAAMRETLPLDVFLFDCLHVDGTDLLDEPATGRFARLDEVAGPEIRVPRLVTADVVEARAFLTRALSEGHEGLMAKSGASTYAAGNRGSEWLKVKQTHTFDLVVLAAEWGTGRRKGWLSNLHLGARDPATGAFVMLGKTFKGLTDAMLTWQTERLLKLEVAREGNTVHVRPELVVEIAVNEIQASPHYPAGMALRFARVKSYRRDKSPLEADTIHTVRDLFEATN